MWGPKPSGTSVERSPQGQVWREALRDKCGEKPSGTSVERRGGGGGGGGNKLDKGGSAVL